MIMMTETEATGEVVREMMVTEMGTRMDVITAKRIVTAALGTTCVATTTRRRIAATKSTWAIRAIIRMDTVGATRPDTMRATTEAEASSEESSAGDRTVTVAAMAVGATTGETIVVRVPAELHSTMVIAMG